MFRSQFLRNTSTLALGIFIAQIFNFAIYPILGRIYTPEDFALLANITSVCSILTVIATGKFEMSILLCKSETDAKNVFALCILSSVGILGISALLFILIGSWISNLLKDPRLTSFLYVAIGMSMAIIIFNCYNEWCVRNQQYKILAINKINNSAAIAFSKLGSGFPYCIFNGLVWGDFIGRWISAIGCLIRLKHNHPDFIKELNISIIIKNAKRFIKFPLYILPGQLLNVFSTTLPIFLLTYYYGPSITGYYSMALSLLLLPVGIISNAIKDVLRQKIVTEIKKGNNCRILISKLLILLFIICTSIAIIIYPFLPDIFSIFAGSKWIEAGEYCQILLIMAVADFLAMSLNGVLLAAEKLKIIFIWQILFFLSTIIPLIIGGKNNITIHDTLLFFAICRSIGYLIYILLTYIYIPNSKVTNNEF